MKGKMLIIGTMDVEGETLNGAFIEAEKSELDSRFFGDVVVVKRESEYQDMKETLKECNEFLDCTDFNDFDSEDWAKVPELIEKAEEALKKAERRDLSKAAMQGILGKQAAAGDQLGDLTNQNMDKVAEASVHFAEALLEKLNES